MRAPAWARTALAATVCLLGGGAAAEARPAAKPDLRVSSVSTPANKVAEGATFRVRDAVVNAGRGRAGRSVTRFYLTRDVRASLAERRASRAHPRVSATDLLLTG
jgi:hypothetical protein